jgi:signal transduction histidine kinase
VFATAAAAALVLAALGFAWHALHFGLTDHASAGKLARDVRRLVAERTRQIQSLAERVASQGNLVESAETETNTDALSQLFASLANERIRTVGYERMSITVYVPTAARGGYRVLAWSDGAAEDIEPERLAGSRALFVRPGTAGLLLVDVHPIESHGRRVGVAAAETVLTPAAPVGTSTQLETAFGPVTVELPALNQGAGAGGDEAGSFLVSSANNEPLLNVRYSTAALSAERQLGYRRVASVAALPLVVLVFLLTGSLVATRPRIGSATRYILWSAMISGLLVSGGAALGLLLRTLGAPAGTLNLCLALSALGATVLIPVSLWWRPQRRWIPASAPVQFVLEQLLAGTSLSLLLLLLQRVSQDRRTAAIVPGEWALFPLDVSGLARLLLQIAICWTLATSLAALASRWRLSWRSPRPWLAALALWLAPAVVVAFFFRDRTTLPPAVWTPLVGALVTFALLATPIRRYYRRTTQAMRLVLLFSALFLPTAVLYPAAAMNADATTRRTIEAEYSPLLADQPRLVREALARAQTEIDAAWPRLWELINATPANPVRSQNAFSVWNTTSLSRSRLTSDVELYAKDGSLVNRFALNIPEYTSTASVQKWQGSGCAWQTFDEPRRLGAEERRVLRAERGVCDDHGNMQGAIVVHVVLDYQSLPFVTSANPYADVLPASETAFGESRLRDLQVVVYGWSLYPISPSSQLTWPITSDLFEHLYRSRQPFWQTLASAERRYHVHFTSDRTGIYAIGFPASTAFDHATRLAELAAVTAVLFVGFLVGAAIYGPFAQRRDAPLRLLFDEIRTSFYRKLFLFFVFAAVMPVVMFALAFGAYMQNRFRADIVSEATNVVTVASRVLEEWAAAEQRPDQLPNAPTDDVMVGIGQIIHQHVNLFEGSQLKATSQRDLFESGLLPMRTPAAAYRSIVLDRLPTVVKEDRLGSLLYQVAAAQVPSYGRDAVISVPLALRQREIEQQIAELNRGVLAGAVVVVLFAAGLGASVAGRISDPVARLTRATRQIAAGQLDVRIVADTADELRRLVDDFNSMAATLVAQRAALARTNQLKAWNEMAVQVAHEIKNPLTPIQLSAEHLQRVHEDARRPLGVVFDQCVATILRQVRLLRQIAGEFSNFAGEPTARPTTVNVRDLIEEVVAPYRTGLGQRVTFELPPANPPFAVVVDRTLIARALTNVIENALHAMPQGGTFRVTTAPEEQFVVVALVDTGVGMDAEAARRAFEPYFSTRTAGSGLGLANAKRNIELCGGTISLSSILGRGTTVTIRLPVAARASAATG